MIYFHYFDLESDCNDALENDYSEPWVSYTEDVHRVNYNLSGYIKEYLTIEALETGNIVWELGEKTAQYSKNGGDWTTMDSSTTISVVSGDTVRFKGENSEYSRNTFSATTCRFNVYGNIMSLSYGDSFVGESTLNANHFEFLFTKSKVVSAENLKLTAKILTDHCYADMFADSTTITTPPTSIGGKKTGGYCCYEMFYNCTALTSAPALPATELSGSCYSSMFRGCKSLLYPPELPATEVYGSTYANMFSGCTALLEGPELPATSVGVSAYRCMFFGCRNMTKGPSVLPATTIQQQAYQQMFYGCYSLTAAPEIMLSGISYATSGCGEMFCNCSSMTIAPTKLYVDRAPNAAGLYANMFSGCKSLTTAPEIPNFTGSSPYGYQMFYRMFYNCTSLNHMKVMWLTPPSTGYTSEWVYGVSNTGTYVKNAEATYTETFSTSSIPKDSSHHWTVTTASE